jgi:hypothetical protein
MHACMHACTYVCVCVCVYIYNICVHAYTYIHVCTYYKSARNPRKAVACVWEHGMSLDVRACGRKLVLCPTHIYLVAHLSLKIAPHSIHVISELVYFLVLIVSNTVCSLLGLLLLVLIVQFQLRASFLFCIDGWSKYHAKEDAFCTLRRTCSDLTFASSSSMVMRNSLTCCDWVHTLS